MVEFFLFILAVIFAMISIKLLTHKSGNHDIDLFLKIAGIIKFSPPTVSSQTQYHSMIDGTLELAGGALLDVDYHTNIASNIKISGDSNIDVAQDIT